MKSKVVFAAVGVLALFSVAGCSEKTEEAAETATQSAAQDTQRNVEGAGQAMENTAQNAGQAVENTAQGAANETQDAAAAVILTPKVKNAIIADAALNDPKNTINVDTENQIVYLKGTVASEQLKQRAQAVAQKVLTDSKSSATLENQLTVNKM